MNAPTLMADFEHCHEVTALLLRYTQALITQTAQTAVCNRHHMVDQHLYRWLLMRLERRTCECYGVVKREYDRLIPAAAAQAPKIMLPLIDSPVSVF